MSKINIFCSLLLTFAFAPVAFGQQSSTRTHHDLLWNDAQPDAVLAFKNADFQPLTKKIPIFTKQLSVKSKGELRASIANAIYQPLKKTLGDAERNLLTFEPTFTQNVWQARNLYYGEVSLPALRKDAFGNIEKLVSFDLTVDFFPKNTPNTPPNTTERGPNTTNSALRDGDIYKFSITETGIHKIDYDFLKNKLKISNIDNIDPRKIHLYGNGGAMLPEPINSPRADDLIENAIFVSGESDAKFDGGDYLLFYAQNTDKWNFNANTRDFTMTKNLYSDKSFYYIKIENSNGLRIAEQNSIEDISFTSTTFDDYGHYEEEKVNLLNRGKPSTQGTGKRWFGDYFYTSRDKNFANLFTFPNIVTTEPVRLRSEFAGRSNTSTFFKININSNTFVSDNIPNIETGSVNESNYANIGRIFNNFLPTADNMNVMVSYPDVGQFSEGWLDYIELNARRNLKMSGGQMRFRDSKTLSQAATKFKIETAQDLTLWDITNPQKPYKQLTTFANNSLEFGAETQDKLKEFVAFKSDASFFSPTAVGKVENQNLHGLDNLDMVILYYKDFENATQQLATHHRQHAQLDVATVRVDKVYEEFSCGRQDVTAIRDFAKMLYDRNPQKFKYLLLVGDGSFDYKNISGSDDNQSYIPVYETTESIDPINSFPTDDFYALLSPGEGDVSLNGGLDIAVGRLTVRNADEARAVVNKIIRYETNPNTLGDWRNRITYVADDEDYNGHLLDANEVAEKVIARNKVFNVDKIFLDATPQVATPGGARYPDAENDINNDIFKGVLIMNYMGHGSTKGWAQERVLTSTDIGSWTNTDKMPLLVTATCTFAAFDDPTNTSAGEQTLLKENGGAVALFTTVRPVYASANAALAGAVFDTIFQRYSSEPNIGEVLRIAKNISGNTINARKFTLLGDPAMKLALPKYNVATTKINNHNVSDGKSDTLRALQKVTIEGIIQDESGQILSNFNGKIFPTVFDKVATISTLAQDPTSQKTTFTIQKNILFKGAASVVNGAFKFSFVIPKDINYQYGFGKISYYAHDGKKDDANGYYNNVVIGGTNPNAVADNQGPKVEVFMNDDKFIFGGKTDQNPSIYARLTDDTGINVTGTSVGHDLTAVLDENGLQTYLLNDFYQAKLDDYTQGELRYPLSKIAIGTHKVRVKAWDINNNPGEGSTEFLVAADAQTALNHVLNFPNPFTTKTSFQFEHGYAGQLLDIQVRIYTVSGKLVKTITDQQLSESNRISGIEWDGKDDFGGDIGRGVYVYKVLLRKASDTASAAVSESEFEKLVILK